MKRNVSSENFNVGKKRMACELWHKQHEKKNRNDSLAMHSTTAMSKSMGFAPEKFPDTKMAMLISTLQAFFN